MKRVLLLGSFVVFPLCAAAKTGSATFRTSDGVTLHYLDAGSGRAIVLVPGWTMAADIFQPQIDGLAPRFRIVAVDPRSQGDSGKTSDGNHLERHAQDIHELIEHLRLQFVDEPEHFNTVLADFVDSLPASSVTTAK
jgi:pimeloyl-ACP methyl ester carboxylesterase